MKKLLSGLAVIIFTGAGCLNNQLASSTPTPNNDPYATWQTIEKAGIIELKVPSDCTTDAGAGTTGVTCPIGESNVPTHVMSLSSDGITANVRRIDKTWTDWEQSLESLRVLTPLDRPITINIEP